jgi:hypothetical protein
MASLSSRTPSIAVAPGELETGSGTVPGGTSSLCFDIVKQYQCTRANSRKGKS